MKYNKTSERIGASGIITMLLSIIIIIVTDISNVISPFEHSHILSVILMAAGGILTLIGLFTGGFEKNDALVSEEEQWRLV